MTSPHTTTDTGFDKLAEIHDRDPSSLGGPTRTEKEESERQEPEKPEKEPEEEEEEEEKKSPEPKHNKK